VVSLSGLLQVTKTKREACALALGEASTLDMKQEYFILLGRLELIVADMYKE
jgi:hypothetical protein